MLAIVEEPLAVGRPQSASGGHRVKKILLRSRPRSRTFGLAPLPRALPGCTARGRPRGRSASSLKLCAMDLRAARSRAGTRRENSSTFVTGCTQRAMSDGKDLRILSRRVKQRHVERFAGVCGISLFTISSSAYGNLVIAPRLEHAPDFLRAMLGGAGCRR